MLGQSPSSSAAKSGAVSAEAASFPPTLTPEALAEALLGLSPDDRARLAAMLLNQPTAHP
jgi:hypothetical protein